MEQAMREFDLKRAADAYAKAWADARKHGDDAVDALKMVEKASSEMAKKAFAERAERAIAASESYRRAAEICLKVMDNKDRRLHPHSG
jgi:hypothetical protein